MKHLFWRLFLVAIFFVFLSSFFSAHVNAIEFSTATIRPERNKISASPVPILITAQVSDNSVTEDQLKVIVSSLWTISNTVSNYTVSTTGLPSGVTAWPGIAAATDKTNTTISFPSGNLSSGILYGFYITGGITTNPGTAGSSSDYIWQLATFSGGNQQSMVSIVVPVISNDQIVVTGSVLPPTTDFSAVLSTDDEVTEIPQDTEIEYTITYGSEYDFSTPLTIVAEWSQGTLAGSGSPSVDLLDYVAGSATLGYGSTSPVIDLSQRTITWTISSFPGNTTGQTVKFKLKTTDEYTGSLEVNANVGARITNPVTTTDSTNEITYLYDAPDSTTSSSDSSSTSSTTSTTSTPTPTPVAPAKLQFLRYRLLSVQDTKIDLGVQLNSPASLVLRLRELGTNSKEEIITLLQSRSNHIVTIDNLKPLTKYSVTITATNSTDQVISEELQFLTAKTSVVSKPTQISFSSGGAHFFTTESVANTRLLVPKEETFEIVLELENDETIKSATVYLEQLDSISESDNVLGKLIYGTQLSRTQSNLWSGRIQSPNDPGNYKVTVVVETIYGGKITIQLGSIIVSNPISVFDKDSGQPIERARVFVEKYNEATRLFEMLKAPEYLLTNPLITDHRGFISSTFPQGKYRLSINSLGYQGTVLEFDSYSSSEFPQIFLQREGFPFLDSIWYHIETVMLKFERFQEIMQKEARSQASLSLFTLLALFVTTPLTFLGFIARSQFSLKSFIYSLQHHGLLTSRSSSSYLTGKVLSKEKNLPVSYVLITILDEKSITKATLTAHKNGVFSIPVKFALPGYTALIFSSGFLPQSFSLEKYLQENKKIEILLETEIKQSSFIKILLFLLKKFFADTLEFNILFSFFLAFIFLFIYQNDQAIYFLIISVMNLFIYFYLQVSTYFHTVHFQRKNNSFP